MSWFQRIFGCKEKSQKHAMYDAAMRESGDLIARMREASNSSDVFRAMLADLWAQRLNVPFTTTVYESVQEMKSGTDQDGDHKNS